MFDLPTDRKLRGFVLVQFLIGGAVSEGVFDRGLWSSSREPASQSSLNFSRPPGAAC